jgi:hypothetical protein
LTRAEADSLSFALFGLFTCFFFDWRQPIGIKTNQIISKISSREVLRSFD